MSKRRNKTYRFELSRSQAAMAALAAVVALIWMFVFGVFIGRRYSPDTYVPPPAPRAEATATKAQPAAPPENPAAARFAENLARQKRQALAGAQPASPAKAAPQPAPRPTTPRLQEAYAVQVGAFSEADRAQTVIDELVKEGYRAYMYTGKSGPRFRVRLGPYARRQEADRMAAAAGKRLGVKPYVLQIASE